MRATGGDTTSGQHQNLVGHGDSGKPVRNGQHCAVTSQILQRLLNQPLGLAVQIASGFVQH